MEIEGEEGSKVMLKRASTATIFGRGLGLDTDDQSVSRKHLLLQAGDDGTAEPRVSFRVLGKNPVWVRSGSGGGVRVYRRSESGEFGVGDRFCVSGRRPVWFDLRKIEDGGGGGSGSGSERNSECESELAESAESVDVSSIDPVKVDAEFGFLVIGHEFDQYPKQMLRNAKHWDWFLEDPSKGSDDSEDEDEGTKAMRRGRRKRRRVKGSNGDDDEWTGESEDEKNVLGTVRKAKKPSYWTRSKDNRKVKPPKSTRSDSTSQKKRSLRSEDEEDDETLGGFIADDEDVEGEQEEESEDEEEEEEEEEFIDDEEDE